MLGPAMTTTNVLIRVQARGGKFLAGDIGDAQIAVTDGGGKLVFGPAVTPGSDSGDFVSAWQSGVAPEFVPPSSLGSALYFLQPDANTVGIQVTLDIDEPGFYTFTATALFDRQRFPTSLPVSTSATLWLIPGVDLTAPPGIVLVMPGLAATIQPPSVAGGQATITAKVTMMCGCPIGPTIVVNGQTVPSPWPQQDFAVWGLATLDDGTGIPFDMAWSATSTYTASIAVPSTGAAITQVQVVAFQPRMNNLGYASWKA